MPRRTLRTDVRVEAYPGCILALGCTFKMKFCFISNRKQEAGFMRDLLSRSPLFSGTGLKFATFQMKLRAPQFLAAAFSWQTASVGSELMSCDLVLGDKVGRSARRATMYAPSPAIRRQLWQPAEAVRHRAGPLSTSLAQGLSEWNGALLIRNSSP